MLFQRADMLLLGAFVPPAALAIYNVAVRLMTWLDFPLNALSQMYFPKIAKASHEQGREGVARIYEQSTGLLLALSLPIGVAAFVTAPWLIRWMAGDKYMAAVSLFRILILAGAAKPWGRLLGMSLEASGKPNWNFAMVGFSLVVNLVLLVTLTPAMGILGAAIASTLSIYLTTLAGQLYFKNLMPINKIRTIKMIWHYYCQVKQISTYQIKKINM
jgi:O-antigen/teichoic acid export membrane protein